MGNKCSSGKSVAVDELKDANEIIDVNDNPSQEKTNAFIRQMSSTEAGEEKSRVNMHVEFHAMLHDLKDSGQLSQKNKLMTEIQMKTIGKKIEDTMNEIIKTREGKMKSAVNEEIKTRAGIQEDMTFVDEAKKSAQGILKSQISCEILSDKLQRLVSVSAAKITDGLKEKLDEGDFVAGEA